MVDDDGRNAVPGDASGDGLPLRAGAEIELFPAGIAHGGFAVARHEGRVVFVADAIPGEPVLARITQVKARFANAVALQPLEPHPDRVRHIWPEADIDREPESRPGGAEFGHLRLARQRELKTEVLADALQRFGGIDPRSFESPSRPGQTNGLGQARAQADARASQPGEPGEQSGRHGSHRSEVDWKDGVRPLPDDDRLGGTRWRTRVTLHIDRHGNVGPYAARSHRVIPVASLPLAHRDIEELAPLDGRIPGRGNPGAQLRGPGRIDFVAPAEYDTRMRLRLERGPAPRAAGTVTERADGLEFKVAEDGFWQVHRHAADTLARAVVEAAAGGLDPEAQHLDLYGGVGLFAAVLARAGAAHITSVEAEGAATGHARHNLARWPGATVHAARVEQYLRQLEQQASATERSALRAGTVVIDPPRAGAGREVSEALVRIHPAQLIYVACDPVALARDTGTLQAAGYRLDRLRSFDLFPNTHHVEAVARFIPERPEGTP